MSFAIRFSAEAAAELDAAAAWYDEQRPGLGTALIDAVAAATAALARWPRSGVAVVGLAADLDVRRAPAGRFPYHLAYLVTDDEIRVLALAHDRRRPGYWTPRASR